MNTTSTELALSSLDVYEHGLQPMYESARDAFLGSLASSGVSTEQLLQEHKEGVANRELINAFTASLPAPALTEPMAHEGSVRGVHDCEFESKDPVQLRYIQSALSWSQDRLKGLVSEPSDELQAKIAEPQARLTLIRNDGLTFLDNIVWMPRYIIGFNREKHRLLLATPAIENLDATQIMSGKIGRRRNKLVDERLELAHSSFTDSEARAMFDLEREAFVLKAPRKSAEYWYPNDKIHVNDRGRTQHQIITDKDIIDYGIMDNLIRLAVMFKQTDVLRRALAS